MNRVVETFNDVITANDEMNRLLDPCGARDLSDTASTTSVAETDTITSTTPTCDSVGVENEVATMTLSGSTDVRSSVCDDVSCNENSASVSCHEKLFSYDYIFDECDGADDGMDAEIKELCALIDFD